jgi:hypothetical protein
MHPFCVAMTSNKSTLQGLLKNELSLFVWKPKDYILPLTWWKLHETRDLNIFFVARQNFKILDLKSKPKESLV